MKFQKKKKCFVSIRATASPADIHKWNLITAPFSVTKLHNIQSNYYHRALLESMIKISVDRFDGQRLLPVAIISINEIVEQIQ